MLEQYTFCFLATLNRAYEGTDHGMPIFNKVCANKHLFLSLEASFHMAMIAGLIKSSVVLVTTARISCKI